MNDIYKILNYKEIDSTQDEAKKLINSNNIDFDTVITSSYQTKGRGKGERKWFSANGNIYMTLIIRNNYNINQIYFFPLVISTSIIEVLKQYIKNKFEIYYKWPNDIMIENFKIGGILTEKISKYNKNFLLIGIGINIKSNPNIQLPIKAGNINDFSDKNNNIQIIIEKILQKIYKNKSKFELYGTEFFLNFILKNAYKINEEIKIIHNNSEITGIFKNIDECGNLIIKSQTKNSYHLISMGDIIQ